MKDFNTIVKENIPFKVVYEDIDLVSEEAYVDIRMNWLGASDSSRLLDVNPFPNGSKSKLIKEKVTGEHDESIGKKASVRMGKDIENIILHKVQQFFEEDYTIDKPKDMYGDEETGLGVNFDAIAIYNEQVMFPIEIKAVTKYGRKYYNFNKAMHYQKDGEWQPTRDISWQEVGNIRNSLSYEEKADFYGIPVYYYTQLQQQILASNSDIGILAVLDVDNWDLNLFRVVKDTKFQTELKQIAKATKLKIDTMRKLKNK